MLEKMGLDLEFEEWLVWIAKMLQVRRESLKWGFYCREWGGRWIHWVGLVIMWPGGQVKPELWAEDLLGTSKQGRWNQSFRKMTAGNSGLATKRREPGQWKTFSWAQ